jgi:hypothetical protein
MTDFRLMTAAAVVCAGIVTTTNLAVAQDYMPIVQDCVPATVSPPSWRWWAAYHPDYFARDWGPFFRRHLYRYGQVLVCSAPATPSVILSKY